MSQEKLERESSLAHLLVPTPCRTQWPGSVPLRSTDVSQTLGRHTTLGQRRDDPCIEDRVHPAAPGSSRSSSLSAVLSTSVRVRIPRARRSRRKRRFDPGPTNVPPGTFRQYDKNRVGSSRRTGPHRPPSEVTNGARAVVQRHSTTHTFGLPAGIQCLDSPGQFPSYLGASIVLWPYTWRGRRPALMRPATQKKSMNRNKTMTFSLDCLRLTGLLPPIRGHRFVQLGTT